MKRARGRLDAINVFPVADSDTGTNMYLTLREGNRAIAKLPDDATHREVVAAFARGALMGARGNSGVIVSAYLGAFLRAVDVRGGLGSVDAGQIAEALDAAADGAYAAVGSPVEGTILTVARSAADAAAGAANANATREAAIVAAVVGARAALARTHDELPSARAAGVVDAGAAGLVLQLEMLAETLAGPTALSAIDEVEWEYDDAFADATHASHRHSDGAFEVMFGAESATNLTRALTPRLEALGDSVVVTGSHGWWSAHVHTSTPADAVRVGIGVDARHVVVRGIDGGDAHGARADSVVALTSSPGLADALADAGAAVLVVPDPARLTRRELRRAVREIVGPRSVIVAGNPALREAARDVAEKRAGKSMTVLDVDHEAHVVAAVAAAALATPGEDIAGVMRDAVAATAVGATSVDAAANDVAALVHASTEVVTLIIGRGVNPAVMERVRLAVGTIAPDADVTVYDGFGAMPEILVGVEGPHAP